MLVGGRVVEMGYTNPGLTPNVESRTEFSRRAPVLADAPRVQLVVIPKTSCWQSVCSFEWYLLHGDEGTDKKLCQC